MSGWRTYDAGGHDTYNNYAWDAENNLATETPVGQAAVTRTYDALGWPVEADSSQNIAYIYDPLAERQFFMTGQTFYQGRATLPGGGVAEYLSGPAIAYYWHMDRQGTARLASTPSRTIGLDSAFGPYGEQYAATGPYLWVLAFAGAQAEVLKDTYDSDTRHYYPTQGRWLSPDPAGLAAVDLTNPQSLNRYAYVANNPTTFVDPSGLGGEDDGSYNCILDIPGCVATGTGGFMPVFPVVPIFPVGGGGGGGQSGGGIPHRPPGQAPAPPAGPCNGEPTGCGPYSGFPIWALPIGAGAGFLAWLDTQPDQIPSFNASAHPACAANVLSAAQNNLPGSIQYLGDLPENGGHFNFLLQAILPNPAAASNLAAYLNDPFGTLGPGERFGFFQSLHAEFGTANGSIVTFQGHIDLFNPESDAFAALLHLIVDVLGGHVYQFFTFGTKALGGC